MRLNLADILDVMSMARVYFNELPAEARLAHMDRPLSEGERKALAFLHGSLNLANRRGLLKLDLKMEDLELEYEILDSTVVTDGYDSEAPAAPAGQKRKMHGPVNSGP